MERKTWLDKFVARTSPERYDYPEVTTTSDETPSSPREIAFPRGQSIIFKYPPDEENPLPDQSTDHDKYLPIIRHPTCPKENEENYFETSILRNDEDIAEVEVHVTPKFEGGLIPAEVVGFIEKKKREFMYLVRWRDTGKMKNFASFVPSQQLQERAPGLLISYLEGLVEFTDDADSSSKINECSPMENSNTPQGEAQADVGSTDDSQ